MAVEVMAGGAQDEDLFLTSSHGGLFGIYEFHGAGGSGHCPWLCQHVHRLKRVRMAHRKKKEPKPLMPIISPGFDFLFFVFLAEALKKKPDLSSCKKKVPPNIAKCGFLFEQSYLCEA